MNFFFFFFKKDDLCEKSSRGTTSCHGVDEGEFHFILLFFFVGWRGRRLASLSVGGAVKLAESVRMNYSRPTEETDDSLDVLHGHR